MSKPSYIIDFGFFLSVRSILDFQGTISTPRQYRVAVWSTESGTRSSEFVIEFSTNFSLLRFLFYTEG